MADIWYYYSGSYIVLHNYDPSVVTPATKWSPGQHVCVNKTIRIEGRTLTLPADSTGLFYGMNCFEYGHYFSIIDASQCTNMTSLFENASLNTQIQTPDFSNWNVSNVTNMTRMFRGATVSGITKILCTNWNTSKVTNMSSMFASINNLTLLDLRGWDVSNVDNFDYMFYNNSSLRRIYTDADADWEQYHSIHHDTDMFYLSTNLPNYTYSDVKINRANTIYKYGYFDAEWKKQSVYIKELDNWVETSNIKYKVNDSWQDVEVYK